MRNRIWGRLECTRTSDTRDGFLARQIGDMDERVVERRVDVRHSKHQLALSNLGTERNGRFLLRGLDFLRGLKCIRWSEHPSSLIDTASRRQTSRDVCTMLKHSVRTIFGGLQGGLDDGKRAGTNDIFRSAAEDAPLLR